MTFLDPNDSSMGASSPPDPRLAIIILGAGASRRMGSPKQLLRIDGETLLQRSLRLAAEVGDHVFLVVGAEAEDLLSRVELLGARVVHNPDWQAGMSTSVRAGLQAALAWPEEFDAALFLVVDQPLLHAGLLREMIRQHQQDDARIVAADYGDRLGVPVLFDRAYFPQLLELEGDRGARSLLRKQRNSVARVPFPGGATDLDTPQDLERFRRNHGNV